MSTKYSMLQCTSYHEALLNHIVHILLFPILWFILAIQYKKASLQICITSFCGAQSIAQIPGIKRNCNKKLRITSDRRTIAKCTGRMFSHSLEWKIIQVWKSMRMRQTCSKWWSCKLLSAPTGLWKGIYYFIYEDDKSLISVFILLRSKW